MESRKNLIHTCCHFAKLRPSDVADGIYSHDPNHYTNKIKANNNKKLLLSETNPTKPGIPLELI